MKKVAVIGGGGPAGLASIHNLTRDVVDVEVVAFEINEDVGGAWIYNEDTGCDRFGVPLTTSMYKDLRTNIPKQIMEFSDYRIPEENETYMHHDKFLDYIRNYANHFDLKKHIKFMHMVTRVKLNTSGKWDVTVKDLQSDKETTDVFDYVFVCNGHSSKPFIPDYRGRDVFKGRQMHSHSYRTRDSFKDRKVLLVGSGPSGTDICMEIASVANKAFLSNNHKTPLGSPFQEKGRPAIDHFTESSVVFADGTAEDIDDVIFCTGYQYDCPFLDPSCGVKVDRSYVSTVYRHVVNVEHTSMFFIGLPQLCCIIPVIDLQARYAVAIIKGQFQLPTKQAMIEHAEKDYESKDKSSFHTPRAATHDMNLDESVYFCEVSDESGVAMVPLMYHRIRDASIALQIRDMATFRNYDYLIYKEENAFATRDRSGGQTGDMVRVDPNCPRTFSKRQG